MLSGEVIIQEHVPAVNRILRNSLLMSIVNKFYLDNGCQSDTQLSAVASVNNFGLNAIIFGIPWLVGITLKGNNFRGLSTSLI